GGVDYVGPIAQPLLARELLDAAMLAYPSTFMETSCIAVLEAMAAGLSVVTTKLGALPETTAGFARLVELGTDHAKLVREFAAASISAVEAARSNPVAAMAQREKQIAFVRENYSWAKRAAEWESWLGEILKSA